MLTPVKLEMKPRDALLLAVVAENLRHAVRQLRRHPIMHQPLVKLAIPRLHLLLRRDALTANRADVAREHMLLETALVYWVPACEEDHLLGTRPEVVAANRTVAVEVPLPTRMVVEYGRRNARVALVAVTEVLPLPPFAHPAVVAVVHLVLRTIVVEPARPAKVPREPHAARPAGLRDRLVLVAADDARDELRRRPVDRVVLRGVVASPARIVPVAARRLDPAVPRIVLADTGGAGAGKDASFRRRARAVGRRRHARTLRREQLVDCRALLLLRPRPLLDCPHGALELAWWPVVAGQFASRSRRGVVRVSRHGRVRAGGVRLLAGGASRRVREGATAVGRPRRCGVRVAAAARVRRLSPSVMRLGHGGGGSLRRCRWWGVGYLQGRLFAE